MEFSYKSFTLVCLYDLLVACNEIDHQRDLYFVRLELQVGFLAGAFAVGPTANNQVGFSWLQAVYDY